MAPRQLDRRWWGVLPGRCRGSNRVRYSSGCLIGALQGVRMSDESRAERVDGAPIESAAPVGGGDEDDAADPRNGLEKDRLSQHLAGLGRATESCGRLVD